MIMGVIQLVKYTSSSRQSMKLHMILFYNAIIMEVLL